jgi:hypothetical protein
MNNLTYDDLSEFGSAQQQAQLESVPVVDSPNFIHEHIPDVVDHPLVAQRSAAKRASKKHRMKKAKNVQSEKLRVDFLNKSNATIKELIELYKSVIPNFVDLISDMTQIDNRVDFIKAFKDADLHHSHNYLIGNYQSNNCVNGLKIIV